MNCAVELRPEEFTERLKPIFDGIEKESGRSYDPVHFFKTWQQWMTLGISRTWEAPGAILGAVFTDDLFSGKKRTFGIFWFSLPEVRGTPATSQVFNAWLQAAKEAGCVDAQCSAFESLSPGVRSTGYLKHGFVKSETAFRKEL